MFKIGNNNLSLVCYLILTMTMLIVWCIFSFGILTTNSEVISNSNSPTQSPIHASNADTTEVLEKSETKSAKKLEIVKQIRRVNSDGSFVVGYEAGDGTFKIESRDVLGNIKGTYGYIDDNGEIKRVSYTANNTTQSSLLTENPTPTPATVRIPKRTSTPATTTMKFHTTTMKFHPIMKKMDSDPPTTVVYASSPPTSSTPPISTTIKSVPRINKIEINDQFSKVQFNNSSNRQQVRRQLPNDQQVIYSHHSDDDSVHGTQRPIYSTASPRIPALVLAARNRAAALKNAAAEKTYAKTPRRKIEPAEEKVQVSEPSVETESEVIPIPISSNKENGHAYLPYASKLKSGQREVESEQYLRETSTDIMHNNDGNAETHPIMQSFNPNYQRFYNGQRFQPQPQVSPINNNNKYIIKCYDQSTQWNDLYSLFFSRFHRYKAQINRTNKIILIDL